VAEWADDHIAELLSEQPLAVNPQLAGDHHHHHHHH